MGLKDCKIVLKNNKHNVYHPGETINGYVEYVFDSVKKVRGIYITFKGVAETSWVEEANDKPKINVAYSGREELFNHSYYILGDAIAFKSHKIEISPGIHRYPFTCSLPSSLPTSFEDKIGFIRYTVKVTLDRPWKFDQDIKMAFTVVDHYDMNMTTELKLPASVHIDERFCSFLCRSSPVIINVSTPLSGYCSGQKIPLNISCDNNSNVDVREITITLTQVILYTSQLPTHHVKIVKNGISEIKVGFVRQYSKENWNKSLKIPVLPPTSHNKSSLIDISYEIKIKCFHSGLHQDIKEKTTIVIGTVPIVDTVHGHLKKIVENGLVNNKSIHTHNTHALQDKNVAMGSMEYVDGCNSAITILEPHESPLTRVQHATPFVPKYPSYKKL